MSFTRLLLLTSLLFVHRIVAEYEVKSIKVNSNNEVEAKLKSGETKKLALAKDDVLTTPPFTYQPSTGLGTWVNTGHNSGKSFKWDGETFLENGNKWKTKDVNKQLTLWAKKFLSANGSKDVTLKQKSQMTTFKRDGGSSGAKRGHYDDIYDVYGEYGEYDFYDRAYEELYEEMYDIMESDAAMRSYIQGFNAGFRAANRKKQHHYY